MEFENFKLPFGGKLISKNRWVQLAKLIPWEEVEEESLEQSLLSVFNIEIYIQLYTSKMVDTI